ncbi:CidA/LrgA family holin-like protein [Bacillus sp. OAE603]|uniref:CidA/LrgA family protein n=1 Tax=Gottfriedia sp. OAE603 TaxID=2663872 RepID=UPI00178A7E99
MKYAYIIVQIAFLYCLNFIGITIQNKFHLMIPGSIIGMFILFCLLNIPIFKDKWVREGSNFLNKHLTLFFIPATVGIIQYSSLLNGSGLISIVIVLISTIVTMVFSSTLSFFLSSRKEQNKEQLVRSEFDGK